MCDSLREHRFHESTDESADEGQALDEHPADEEPEDDEAMDEEPVDDEGMDEEPVDDQVMIDIPVDDDGPIPDHSYHSYDDDSDDDTTGEVLREYFTKYNSYFELMTDDIREKMSHCK